MIRLVSLNNKSLLFLSPLAAQKIPAFAHRLFFFSYTLYTAVFYRKPYVDLNRICRFKKQAYIGPI